MKPQNPHMQTSKQASERQQGSKSPHQTHAWPIKPETLLERAYTATEQQGSSEKCEAEKRAEPSEAEVMGRQSHPLKKGWDGILAVHMAATPTSTCPHSGPQTLNDPTTISKRRILLGDRSSEDGSDIVFGRTIHGLDCKVRGKSYSPIFTCTLHWQHHLAHLLHPFVTPLLV